MQGDSGGKVNIVGCGSTGIGCKLFLRTCVYFWMVTEKDLFESTSTEASLTVLKKDKLLTVDCILMLI
jgi:hypothetical protein